MKKYVKRPTVVKFFVRMIDDGLFYSKTIHFMVIMINLVDHIYIYICLFT